MNPQRIMAYPYTCYIAPQGTEFPALTRTDAQLETDKFKNTLTSGAEVTWTKLGTSGNRDYSDAGVTVTHMQTISTFQGAGSTWVRKAWRSDEGLQVAFDLADISPKQYAAILDEATVTATSAEESFSLNRGLQVKGQAMFLRGISSVTEGKVSQYEIPYCYQAANPAPKFAIKGGPALLSVQFTAIEGEASTAALPNAGLPKLRVQI
jgi:hypothetical protein